MRRQLHVTCNLHAFQSAMKFFKIEKERDEDMQTKIIFISLFVFLLLLLKLFWKRYGTIYTRYDFDRFECDAHHHVFTSNFQLWSHLFNPLDCARADVAAVATVIQRNDSDYNNNYKFRKSKWASRKTEEKTKRQTQLLCDIRGTVPCQDRTSLKIVRCLNERT